MLIIEFAFQYVISHLYPRTRCLKFRTVGECPGLVVMGKDTCPEGCGFESRHYILVGHFSHIFVVKIVMMFV